MDVECVPKHGRRSHLTILCDEDLWREIHTSIFGKNPSLPKNCTSIEEFSQKFALLEYSQARQYVIRRLSAQNLPSTTLARALKRFLVSQDVIERVLEEFCKAGFINDVNWTKGFVDYQVARRLGPRAIAQKLASKGLSKEYIEPALKASTSIPQQKKAIQELLKTRFKQRDLTNFKEKQKVVAALARRGFDFSLVLEVLRVDTFGDDPESTFPPSD